MEKDSFELTTPQKSIWMTEKFYQTDNISNVGGSLIFNEKVDFALLQEAIQLFIKKNDSMRLSIKLKDGIAYQYVCSFKPIKIDCYDVNSDEEFHSLDNKLGLEHLDLAKGILSRFHLIRFPDGHGGFHATLHHLISDAWSMSLVINEVSSLYTKLRNNEKIEENNYPSYIDYINSEKKYINSEKFNKDAEFWKGYFDFSPSQVSFSSKNLSTSKQEANRFEFPLKNSSTIYEFCKKYNIPIYTFFVAIYSIYLYKISDTSNIILGTPILNRNGFKEKNTMGMFVNTLPVVAKFTKNMTFSELVDSISKDQFSIFRHHKYPYSDILRHVREKYNFSNNLYDTRISYQNARDDRKKSELDYFTTWNFCGAISNSLDIHIYDMDDSGILKLMYDYQLDKFTEEEVKNINYRIQFIIEQIISNKDIVINKIELLDDFESKKLEVFNDNDTKYDDTEIIISLFDKQVKKSPNNIALKFKNKELTYGELNKYVCRFAGYLRKKGITKNTPVVLLIDRSLEMVIAMLAVLKAGGYYIAIDPFWPNDRTNFIIQNSNSKFLITNQKRIANFEDKINCILVDNIYQLKNDEIIENITTPSDLAYILYTSGSTGEPKGTLITNKNVVGLLNATNHIFNQNEKDIWTLFHTYTFDFSTWEIYGSLLYGCKLIIVPKETTTNPKEFLELVVNEKVTILNQTPAYFYKVIEQEKLLGLEPDNLSVRYVILGGEAVQAKPLKYFKEKYPDIAIYNGYGPTETTVFAIMCEITKDDIMNDDIYIGYPISNYNVHILDKHNNLLPVGVDGEICISGVGVCNGYFKKPDLTSEKFVKTKKFGLIYKSGDVGHFCNNGRIKYIGRNDNQVKIRGFRIELDEIQKQILNCDNVTKAVVVPVENQNFTKSLVAFFEASIPNITSIVLEQIRKNLTAYMIPKLYQVDEFPVNNNGKVDVKYLINNVYNSDNHDEIVKPKNNLEKELLLILKNITNISHISTTHDFFEDLGLDSLNIMDFATRLSKYHIEIQDINNYTTIQKLAKKIEDDTHVNLFDDKIQNDIKIVNKSFKFDMTNVLLTGVTGFLGSHILYELLINPAVSKIYCLIREKYNVTVEDRFNKIANTYFKGYNINDIIKQKVVLLNGNFEKVYLGLGLEKYYKLSKIITTVVHSGANVRHYGKYDVFYRANVQATKNIIQFCEDGNCKLAHISTVSVGGYTKTNENNLLTENLLNINQTFNNHVYMVTKYEAECAILREVADNKLKAKIFRLGNIMPRYKDGKFQINMHQNGFLSRLKTLIDIQASTAQIDYFSIDISPVDLCAKAIVLLMENKTSHTIYHISNPQIVYLKDIFNIFGIKLNIVDTQTCIDLIKNQNIPLNAHLINDLILNEYKETPFDCNITVKELENLDFTWKKINQDYIMNLYNLLLQI